MRPRKLSVFKPDSEATEADDSGDSDCRCPWCDRPLRIVIGRDGPDENDDDGPTKPA